MLVIPVGVLAVVAVKITARFVWRDIVEDLLPFSDDFWRPYGVTLLETLFCPSAFVSAGTTIAPSDRMWIVPVVLAVLYEAVFIGTVAAHSLSEQWLYGIPSIGLSLFSATVGIFVAREQREAETKVTETT